MVESWVNFDWKEGHTIIQISAETGIEPGTLWLEDKERSFQFYAIETGFNQWRQQRVVNSHKVLNSKDKCKD